MTDSEAVRLRGRRRRLGATGGCANLDAFERWRIVPRMLRDVSVRDLERYGARHPVPAPVLLAPVGVQSIVHRRGASWRLRARRHAHGLPCILSTAASHTIEEVAEAMRRRAPAGISSTGQAIASWRPASSRAPSRPAIERSCVTLDTWILGWRPRDLQHGLPAVPERRGRRELLQRPGRFAPRSSSRRRSDPSAAIGHWAYQFSNPTVDLGRTSPGCASRPAADRAEGRSLHAGATRSARSTPAWTG